MEKHVTESDLRNLVGHGVWYRMSDGHFGHGILKRMRGMGHAIINDDGTEVHVHVNDMFMTWCGKMSAGLR